VTEDRNALNFASKRQRRDVDVVVASLLGASKHNNDSDGPVHNHSYQNESSHNITLSPVSIHKSNPHDHDTSASDVQVKIAVCLILSLPRHLDLLQTNQLPTSKYHCAFYAAF
jgi:hypothetical protein